MSLPSKDRSGENAATRKGILGIFKRKGASPGDGATSFCSCDEGGAEHSLSSSAPLAAETSSAPAVNEEVNASPLTAAPDDACAPASEGEKLSPSETEGWAVSVTNIASGTKVDSGTEGASEEKGAASEGKLRRKLVDIFKRGKKGAEEGGKSSSDGSAIDGNEQPQSPQNLTTGAQNVPVAPAASGIQSAQNGQQSAARTAESAGKGGSGAQYASENAQNPTTGVQKPAKKGRWSARGRAASEGAAPSEEEIRRQLQAEALSKELKRESRRESALSAVSLIWTLISTVFAIASTCVYIGKRWVDSAFTYVLIGALALYVGIFLGFVIVAFRNPRKSKKEAKDYKKLIQIFKSIVSLSFLVLTAIDMAALALADIGFVKWLMFGISFIVALVQLVFRVWLFVVGIVKRRLGRMYNVNVSNYVDGKSKRRSLSDVMKERSYK